MKGKGRESKRKVKEKKYICIKKKSRALIFLFGRKRVFVFC